MNNKLNNISRLVQQHQARAFIVEHGKSQKETAALVGVSEKSISKWVRKFKWKAEQWQNLNNTAQANLSALLKSPTIPNSMADKKAKAKEFLEVFGYNQKQTADILNVSKTTIKRWVKKGGWKVANRYIKSEKLTTTGIVHISIGKFIDYIKSANEPIGKEVEALWQRYKDSLHS